MNGPECPQHGDLVLQLALGELEIKAAEAADEALASCDHCASWYRANLGVPAVAEGVIAGVAAFCAHRTKAVAQRRLAAMAAALMLLLGGFAAFYLTVDTQRSPSIATATSRPHQIIPPPAPAGQPQKPEAWLQAFTFHGEQQQQQPIFADRLESGDLGAWTIRN